NVISGLHTFLKADAELVAEARKHRVILWDVRETDNANIIAERRTRPRGVEVITMVGSDCVVGKMCTGLELTETANCDGIKSHFIATGQTGILITGSGTPLDRVIGDFMAGHVERCIFEA